jgi:hypothetical protein
VGKNISAYRVLIRKPEGKSPHGKPLCRGQNNVKLELNEIG